MPPSPASGKLLREEPPLIVLPYLAATIGLSEAILLQQIHYWLQRAGKERDGRLWIYNTYADWAAQLPFWSETAIRRIVRRLQHLGLIFVANYNRKSYDRTLWYSINYEAVAALDLPDVLPARVLTPGALPSDAGGRRADQLDASSTGATRQVSHNDRPSVQSSGPSVQSGGPSVQSGGPSVQSGGPSVQSGAPCGEIGAPIPEITTEITSETNTERGRDYARTARSPSPYG